MDLKKKAKNLDATLRIGKRGMTDSIVSELDKLLKKRKLVKVKILNNCPIENTDDLIKFLVERSDSKLIQKIGNTFTLYRD